MQEQMKEQAKNNQPLKSRVMGVSFGDYADVKFMGGDGVNDPWIQKSMHVNIPKNYSPYMSQQPVDVNRSQQGVLTVKPFTAAQKKLFGTESKTPEIDIFTGAVAQKGIKTRKIIWPKYYQNPYQYQDYIFLQDIYANTICGRIFDTLGYFALANGIKPKLRVKNEGEFKDDKAKQAALQEHKWMTDELEEIEKSISTSSMPKEFELNDDEGLPNTGPLMHAESPSTPVYDTPLQKKWFAAFINEMMFGRDIIIPRIDEDDNIVKIQSVKGEEIEYKNIPKIMLIVHPRDIGFNYIDYYTHRLLGIQLYHSNWILKPDEIIFWENKPDNPVYGTKFYGMAEAQSMMGSARTLRRIIEVDFPLIAKTRWSGMYWLVFKRKGEQAGTSDQELTNILSNIELNGINATLEDEPKEDFMLHKIDLDPKIAELLQTVKDLIQYMMSQVGMPQGLLYGEDSLNRDTLKAKISSWTKGSLKYYRNPFLQVITDQWYRRLAKTLEKQSPKWEKALKIFDIEASVDEFKLDNREELINALMMLENITGAWTDEARAEFLEMDDLQQRIDPDKDEMDVPPMPGSGQSNFNVKDNQTGKEFGVSNSK
ncbi:MAG: hypothetical protein ACW99F_03385 [Candidatus Hodarchaeales archaeon]